MRRLLLVGHFTRRTVTNNEKWNASEPTPFTSLVHLDSIGHSVLLPLFQSDIIRTDFFFFLRIQFIFYLLQYNNKLQQQQ